MKPIVKPSEEPAGEEVEQAPPAPHAPPAPEPRPGGYKHHDLGHGKQAGRGRNAPAPAGPAPRTRPNSPTRSPRGR